VVAARVHLVSGCPGHDRHRAAPGCEVKVRFVDDGPAATRVELTHSRFDRHGEGGDGYRTAMAEQGWSHLLERYAAVIPSRRRG
jgi:hypothetical protein